MSKIKIIISTAILLVTAIVAYEAYRAIEYEKCIPGIEKNIKGGEQSQFPHRVMDPGIKLHKLTARNMSPILSCSTIAVFGYEVAAREEEDEEVER